MTEFHVTSGLIARVDHFNAAFHMARMGALAALPGNPFGVGVQAFGDGDGVALKVCHPLLRGKNRICGFRAGDIGLLDDLLDFYRADALSCTLFVPHGEMGPVLFQHLARAGLWSLGYGIVPVIMPDNLAEDSALPPGIIVRLSAPKEQEQYLDLFQRAFAAWPEQELEYRAFQWAEDSLPGGTRYIAEVAGLPVGMASFPVIGGVGHCGTAGVLPGYRRRGIQSALIRRRLSDALSFGCDLVVGGNSPETTAFRNFERAGLRLIPSGSTWRELPAI